MYLNIAPKKNALLGFAVILMNASVLHAAPTAPAGEQAAFRDDGRFVQINLDPFLNDNKEAGFSNAPVNVNGIPFLLGTAKDRNNLFLKDAGWADWSEDPSSYNATYDKTPMEKTAAMPVLQIPAQDYAAAYVLAGAEVDEAYSDILSLRIGAKGNASPEAYVDAGKGAMATNSIRVTYHDFSGMVPRLDKSAGENVLKHFPFKNENFFVVKIPIGKAIAQDFAERRLLDVEVTKQIRLSVSAPNPARFQMRPLGLPSGVHIYAMTFERSPVQMEITGSEAGNVFNQPEVPLFRVTLTPLKGVRTGKFTLRTTLVDYYGNTIEGPAQQVPDDGKPVDLKLPLNKCGWYAVSFRLEDFAGKNVLRRETTLALLPPESREHRAESPFGTWDFSGGHFTSADAKILGPLYRKAGLRYGMFRQSEEVRREYGVLQGLDPKYQPKNTPLKPGDPTLATYLSEWAQTNPEWKDDKHLLIFHENVISGKHIMRVPDAITGAPPYKFDAEEEKKFQDMWNYALETAKQAKEIDPAIKLHFGNGMPHLLEEFLRRNFPRELIDFRGNEAGSFQRPPEAQPPDAVANNAGLWMDRMILDHYGYKDVPLAQCYEMCYPGTNPGNLSLETQAAYFVRHALHSLAWKVPVIRMGLITDTGNSYYFSNWGSAGLCFAKPAITPKPSYVAIATLTRVLDGASFIRQIPMASDVVYAFEFQRKDKKYVTALWTLVGTRGLSLEAPQAGDIIETDLMDNDRAVNFSNGSGEVRVGTNPVFLTSQEPLKMSGLNAPVYDTPADKKSFTISALDTLADWTVKDERNTELEVYSFDQPRRKGDFAYEEVDSFEGKDKVLKITPKLPVPGSEYLPMYSVLEHKTGIEIPGVPTEISILVNGNGGWGRVIWELEDAKGQRWISVGAEQKGKPSAWMADFMSKEEFANLKGANLNDWSTNDAWGKSVINFDGWRTIRFPLPGNYPGEGYHWPYSSQWRCQAADGSQGDGVVKYPLKLKKLIFSIPEKILKGTEYRPPLRPGIYIRDLAVTYDER